MIKWRIVLLGMAIFLGEFAYSQNVVFRPDDPDEEVGNACEAPDNSKAKKAFEQGIDRKKNKKPERVQYLRKALDLEPEYVDAHYYLALELIKTAETKGTSFKSAERHLSEVVRLCPDYHYQPYYYLGALALGRKEYEACIRYYDKYYELTELSDDPIDEKEYEEIRLDYEYAKFFRDQFANPVPFNPVKVKNVSTVDKQEFLPIISADNKSLIFTRRVSQQGLVRGSSVGGSSNFVEKLSISTGTNGNFDEGKPLPEPFNMKSNYRYGGACMSIDNKHIYFTICIPDGRGYNNCDIYFSDYVFGVNPTNEQAEWYWTEPKNMGNNINGPTTWESQPSISSDGRTLYFASAREGAKGIDIFYSKKQENGLWSKAENMGPPVNTEYNDKTPFMHSDSKTLYFSSDGHTGFGGYDVFYCRQDDAGNWLQPKNIGYPINTEEDEHGFIVSTDGKMVYFSSDKVDGEKSKNLDIYRFELYKEARPEKVKFLQGEVKDKNGDPVENARIEIKNMNTKAITKIDVDAQDGKYAAVVSVREDEDLVVNFKAEDMAFNSILIEADEKKEDDDIFEEVNMEVEELQIGGVYKLNNIYYRTNSADISPKSKLILDEFAEYLIENEGLKIEIHGHTDNVGEYDENMVLSTDRAFSVKQYLEEKGVKGDRLKHRGFGESNPYTSNATEEGRAKNRRTEFLIVSK